MGRKKKQEIEEVKVVPNETQNLSYFTPDEEENMWTAEELAQSLPKEEAPKKPETLEELETAVEDNIGEKIEKEVVDIATAEKEFEAYRQIVLIWRNGLLGRYIDGEYKLDQNVIDALIMLKKTRKEQFENSFTCAGIVRKHTIDFLVKYDKNPTFCSARLYLVESVDEIANIKTIETEVAHSVQPANITFLENIEKEWNIDQASTTNDEKTLSTLDAILIGVNKDYEFNSDLLEILSQIYILRLTALLGECGEYGNTIMEEYRKLVNEYATKRPAILRSNIMLKEILDKVLKDNNALEVLRDRKPTELAMIMQEYTAPITRVNPPEKNRPYIVNNEVVIAKPNKKEAEKSATEEPVKKAKSSESAPKSKSKGSKSTPVVGPKIKPYKNNYKVSGGPSLPKLARSPIIVQQLQPRELPPKEAPAPRVAGGGAKAPAKAVVEPTPVRGIDEHLDNKLDGSFAEIDNKGLDKNIAKSQDKGLDRV